MKFNKESIRGKQIMDSARPLLKTISEGIKKPMKFDHGGYYPANTYYVYLETNNPDYLQEHGFGDNPAMQIKADTIYEAIDHVKRNMPEDAEMHSISAYETKKSKGGGIYAIGGMVEHGLMIGDTIIDEYKDYGIIKDKSGNFYVYDPNVGERKKIDGVVYEDIMFSGKKIIDDIDKSYMRRAGLMKDGGDIEKGNLEMIKSNVKEIKHHADELEDQLKLNPEIEAWVLAKADRASTALSDITHYLDGKKYALGGLTPGRFYKDNQGIEYKFIGKIDNGPKKGQLLFNDGKNSVYKSLDEFDGAPKENKLFGFFADGGELKLKKNNLLKYLQLFPNDAKSWNQATDELRDIARMSRMTYLEVDEKNYPALDFKQLKTPGEWNTKSKSYIKEMYTRMSNKAKKEFLDNFEETFNDKMVSGGQTNKEIDLFEYYELIPLNVQKVLDKYNEGLEEGDYKALKMAKNELETIGYTFDYDLGGGASNLRKMASGGVKKINLGEDRNGKPYKIGDIISLGAYYFEIMKDNDGKIILATLDSRFAPYGKNYQIGSPGFNDVLKQGVIFSNRTNKMASGGKLKIKY
jgi:hypothetical protein